MFTVSRTNQSGYEFRLDDSVSGTIYIRARTADGSSSKTRPERLCVRDMIVRGKSAASPFATGDDLERGGYGLGLYGSSHVGSLAAIVEKTSVEGILQLDCLKTDFFHDKAYPTYLYYNPFESEKTVRINLAGTAKDLYNPITHDFIAQNVRNQTDLRIPADSAIVVVVGPAGAARTRDGRKLLLDGVVVDYAGTQGTQN